MNNDPDFSPIIKLLGAAALGYLAFKVIDEFQDEEIQTEREPTTRTKTLPDSRDPEEVFVRGIKAEKDSLPNFSDKILKQRSRSSGIESSSNPLTSRMTSTITSPSITSDRKYPIHYYSMSEKNKWKFRKQFNTLSCSVV